MKHSRPLFLFFSVVSNKHEFLYNQIMWKYPSSICFQDSNPRPLEHESLPITSRPGLQHCLFTRFSWLLRHPHIQVRSSHPFYMERVSKYFEQLLAQIRHLQFFTKHGHKGGPIILVQVSLLPSFVKFTQTIIKKPNCYCYF